MESKQKIRRCFLIGPMKDIKRLRKLKDEVLVPILEPEGFDVSTPDEGNVGNIMQHVLLNLEQADLLVADITGQNPNVMYELGIYHCFGKPYIILKDSSVKEDISQLPFDIAHYFYGFIDFNNIEDSKQSVGKLVKEILQQVDDLHHFKSPVTDFYSAPVAEIPTAIGLAKNYKKNFLERILPSIFQKDQKGIGYQVEIRVESGRTDACGNAEMRDLTVAERRELTLRILIPEKLEISQHDYIEDAKDAEKILFKSAEVGRKSRPFKLYFYQDVKGNIVLVDIPTVLSTLDQSITLRRSKTDQVKSKDWEILEAQELERFASKCEIYKDDLESSSPLCRGRVFIDWRWNPYN